MVKRSKSEAAAANLQRAARGVVAFADAVLELHKSAANKVEVVCIVCREDFPCNAVKLAENVKALCEGGKQWQS